VRPDHAIHRLLTSICKRAFAVLLSVALGAAAANAQSLDAGASEVQKSPSDVDNRELEELLAGEVSTGTKNVTNAARIPAFVEVITAQEIRDRGYIHLADLLNDIRNNHEDRSNWGIGEPLNQNVGFGYRFDTGQNILILFNGQRLNSFAPGNRFGGEEYLLESLDRVEVIRGPGSAIYGPNAFTAVVNLLSKTSINPGEKDLVRISANGSPTARGGGGQVSLQKRIGQEGLLTGAVRFGKELGQNILVQNTLFGDTRMNDAIRHAISGEVQVNWGNLNVYAKADNQLRDTFTGFNSVSAGLNQLSLSMYAYSLGADHTATLSDTVKIRNAVGVVFDNWTEVALIPIFRVSPDGMSLVRDADGKPILEPTDIPGRGVTPFAIDGQGADTMTVSAESVLSLKYFRDNSLVFGLNAIHDRILGAQRPTEIRINPFEYIQFQSLRDDPNNWLFDTRATRTTLGAFGQIDYEILRGLSVTAGARFDLFLGSGALNETYPAFNPRAGIIYHQQTIGVLKALYGSATRVPNGFETLSSVTILGSPKNRPESLQMFQLSWERTWSAGLRTELGGFYSRLSTRLQTDANITEAQAAQGYIGQYINVDAANPQQSAGVDGKVSVTLGPLRGILNFTRYFATDNGNRQPLAYMPMTMVNANLNLPVWWFNFNVSGNYRGDFVVPENDPRPLRGYVLLNATIQFRPPSLPLELRISGRNLLNWQIQYPSSSLDYPNHFPSRGIDLLADLRYTVSF
jgi:outer membrane receptor for ferrienterochelin and colicins